MALVTAEHSAETLCFSLCVRHHICTVCILRGGLVNGGCCSIVMGHISWIYFCHWSPSHLSELTTGTSTTRWRHLSLRSSRSVSFLLHTLPPAENSLYSGRRWETLNAGMFADVWGGWRSVPAQLPTASSLLDPLHLCLLKYTHVYITICQQNYKQSQ